MKPWPRRPQRISAPPATPGWSLATACLHPREALFRFVEQTVDCDLSEELAFLRGYDRKKRLMQDVVDLPARKLDLFIRLCRQNGGSLSAVKRQPQFAMLSDGEITRLEEAVRQGFGPLHA